MMSGGVLKTPTVANGASVMKRASAFKGRVLPTYDPTLDDDDDDDSPKPACTLMREHERRRAGRRADPYPRTDLPQDQYITQYISSGK